MPRVDFQHRPATDSPLYWFARLDTAIESGDFTAAVEAQRQLAQLGVHVLYIRKSSGQLSVPGTSAAGGR